MERYEKYKDSGVEWIGEIPEGWEVKRLKFLAKMISKGTTPSTIGREINSAGKIRFIKAENIYNYTVIAEPQNFIDEETDNLLSRSQLEEDDILFVIAGATIGKVAILTKEHLPANTNQAVSFIRLLNAENVKFVWFWLQSNYIKILLWLEAVQSAQPNLSMEDLGNFIVPFPSLGVQTVISNFLDRKTAEIDNLITQKERLIELYEEEKAAIINQAVTKGIDPNAKLKDSSVDWLGEIPEGWEVKKLKYILTVNSGDGIKAADIKEIGDYPVYGGNGIAGFTNNFNNCDEVFVIGRVGAKCGNVRLVSGKKWISDNALFTYTTGNLRFLELCLINLDLNRLANKNAQPLITSTMIKVQYVSYPSIREQTVIVQHIETESTRIDKKITKTKRIIELQKEYRTALISEVVTGKIKVTP